MKIAQDYNNQHNNLSFFGYKEAKRYAQCTKLYNKYIHKRLYKCNLDKLDGIQEGLKTFEGLSLKQIAFALTDLHAINMIKGCVNHCLHCYANAQPFISRSTFENFKQIMDDILTLKKRIGVNPVSHRGIKYVDCYFDADGIDMHLFDKDGNKHDAVELAAIIRQSTGMQSVFDTNGWDRNDKEKQKIAEEYVEKLCDKNNSKNFYEINLSLNPFNPQYVKALKDGYNPKNYSPFIPIGNDTLEQEIPEKLKKAEEKYTEYIKNEANMLYTFTPLALQGKLGTIIRALSDNITNMDECTISTYIKTLGNILQNLQTMYILDLRGEQKVIKSKEMLDKAMKKYIELMNRNNTMLFSSGRLENFYIAKHNGSTEGIENIDVNRDITIENYQRIKNAKKLSSTKYLYLKMINADGKVYMYDNYSIIPTDIQLKTSEPNLKTPFWVKVKDFVVTTDMIDII